MKHMIFGNYYEDDNVADSNFRYKLELLIFKDTIVINPISKRCDDNNYYSMYLRIKNFDTENNMFVVEDEIGNIISVSNITPFNKACTAL